MREFGGAPHAMWTSPPIESFTTSVTASATTPRYDAHEVQAHHNMWRCIRAQIGEVDLHTHPRARARARVRPRTLHSFVRVFTGAFYPDISTHRPSSAPTAPPVPLLVPPLIPSLSSLLRPPITPNPRWQRRPPVPLLSTFCPPSFASPQALAHKSFLVQRPRGTRCKRRCRVSHSTPSRQTVPLPLFQ